MMKGLGMDKSTRSASWENSKNISAFLFLQSHYAVARATGSVTAVCKAAPGIFASNSCWFSSFYLCAAVCHHLISRETMLCSTTMLRAPYDCTKLYGRHQPIVQVRCISPLVQESSSWVALSSISIWFKLALKLVWVFFWQSFQLEQSCTLSLQSFWYWHRSFWEVVWQDEHRHEKDAQDHRARTALHCLPTHS